MLPPRDAALRSLRALSLQRAGVARVGPVAAQDQSIFLVREVVGELLAGRTNVNVLLRHIAEVLLAEAPFRLRARCLRFWQRDRDAGLFAGEYLLAFEVAAIGDGFEAFCLQCRLRLVGHVRELRLIGADVGDLVRDDQMVRRINGRLHVVADHAGAAPAGCHRAGIGIGEGYLLIGRGEHLFLDRLEALHLFFELDELLLEPRGPGRKLLRRRLTGGCLAIGRVELAQIARDAVLDLRQPPLHLPFREVVVAAVDGFELAAIDRNAGFRQQPHLPAQGDELRTDLLDGRAVVLAEIGDGFVIRNEASRQPHHFQIAARLTLQPPARLDPVEIAVDVELEHRRRIIRRPARRRRIDAIEPEVAEFQRIDEHIDRANRIALVDPIIEAFRKQRRLLAIRLSNETLHYFPRRFTKRILASTGFSHSLDPKRTRKQRGETHLAAFVSRRTCARCRARVFWTWRATRRGSENSAVRCRRGCNRSDGVFQTDNAPCRCRRFQTRRSFRPRRCSA